MRYRDINQRFTDIVGGYLQEGFLFNTSTMRGSQGETARVDLTKDGLTISVVLEMNKYSESSLYVGVCRDNITPHEDTGWNTIWLNRLDVTLRESYYYIGGDYYATEEEYREVAKKRAARFVLHREAVKSKSLKSEKTLPIARKIIREKFRYKKINDEDIHILKHISSEKNSYVIVYRNYSYELK